MAGTWTGSVFSLVKQERVTNAAGGVTTRWTYEGRQAEIEAQELSLIANGWSTAVTHDGPLWRLEGVIGGDNPGSGEPENPAEYWNWNTEPKLDSIFNMPAVALEAQIYGAANYKKKLEEAVLSGASGSPLPSPPFPVSHNVFTELARGVETREVDQFVIYRTRHYSANYPLRVQLAANSIIYTRAQFIDLFNIPSAVAYSLPADPTETLPPQMMWGYRRNSFASEYDGLNRINERMGFLCGYWSTFLYTPFS